MGLVTCLRLSNPGREPALAFGSKAFRFAPIFAAEPGFEPRYTPPEGVVLPLDDSAKYPTWITIPDFTKWSRVCHVHTLLHTKTPTKGRCFCV
jgi:hypothetical protein